MDLDPKQLVLRRVEEEGIKFVQLWFSDLLGNLKSVEITAQELPSALEEGVGFDGSSIHGFARIDESDMLVRPDPKTFAVLPWGNVARLICDVYEPTGEPYRGDPRWALKRALRRAADMGFSFYVGPEVEYFYFRSPEAPELLDHGGYFDLVPPDEGSELRRETVLALAKMGIGVEAAHHEVAPSQQEIDLRFSDALTMADALMTTRFLVKEIARRHGIHATFMPKPLYGQNGSGMHTHQSLFFQDGRNAFFDPEDPVYLSPVAKGYIAGLMRHAREIIGVCAQWVNSYKRLVPGYEAPVNVAWSYRNRSPLIRVPARRGLSTRAELRSPDPSANPYLALAVTLKAGLQGIKEDLEPPPPVDRNVYELSEKERRELGIASLPGSLEEALDELEKDEVIQQALGEHIFEYFVNAKRIEAEVYRTQVHQWELDQYLAVF